MKIPQLPIPKPKWWKPWYDWQLITLAMLIFNASWALIHPSWFSAVNWFMAGIMFAQLFSNHIIYKALAGQDRLIDAINQLGEMKADEIAAHMNAEYMRVTGHPDAPPLAPTKH